MITTLTLFNYVKQCIILEQQLNEGLIKTYPLKYLKKSLSDILSHSWNNFSFKDIRDDLKTFTELRIDFSENITVEEFLELFKNLTLCGYFISSINIITNNNLEKRETYTIFKQKYLNSTWFKNFKQLEIRIEPKFDIIDKEESDILAFIPNIIYHVTNTKNVTKILKKGLIPKSNNIRSNHPERVYFCGLLKDALEIAPKLHIDWIILKIEITDQNKYKFYRDPNYKNHFYSYDNFSPVDISIVKP